MSRKKMLARMRQLEVKCINRGVTFAEQQEYLALEKMVEYMLK